MKFIKTPLEILEQYVFTAKATTRYDPNDLFKGIFKGTISLSPVPKLKCMVTGDEAIGFQTACSKICLRPDILQRLVLLSLEPEEYKTLITMFPNEHYFESDFYWNGVAQQPKAEYLDPNIWYTPKKDLEKLTATLIPSKNCPDLEIF